MYITYDFTEMGKQLLAASRDGLTEDVSQLLARSAPMTTDWLGTSPLHLAASNGHCSTAEVLMRSGCSRDAKTKVDKTPLHLSATEGHSEMTELLLKSGAEVDSKDMVGKYFLSTKLWHKLIPGMSPEGPKGSNLGLCQSFTHCKGFGQGRAKLKDKDVLYITID